MKSSSKILCGTLLATAILWAGCQTKTPPFAAAVPKPDYYNLMLFTSPTSVEVNPALPVIVPGETLGTLTVGMMGLEPIIPLTSYPTNVVDPNGQLTIDDGGTVENCGPPGGCQPTGGTAVVEPSGLSNYPYDIHVTAWIDDPESPLYEPGPGNYDSVYFRIWPGYDYPPAAPPLSPSQIYHPASTFDVSPYSGLQFYIKVASYDDAIVKQLQIYTPSANHGAPGGQCDINTDPNDLHCWDPFYYDWSAVPRDQWVLVEKYWTDFKAYGNGSIPNPPTLSGANLQQIDWFGFTEGNGALPGPVTCDYAVTGVKFF